MLTRQRAKRQLPKETEYSEVEASSSGAPAVVAVGRKKTCAHATLSTNCEKIFRQITAKTKTFTQQEAKLRQLAQQREGNLRQIQRLTTQVDVVDLDIGRHHEYMARLQIDINGLRHWAPPMQLSDLPDELKVMVLMYTNYEHQQRLVRVCREWKYLIGSVLDHIYLDHSHGLIEFSRAWYHERSRAITPSSPSWKYRCAAVHAVTYNAGFATSVSDFADTGPNSQWLQRFPKFSRLGLVRSSFYVNEPFNRESAEVLDSQPPIHLTTQSCFVSAFPAINELGFLQSKEIGNLSFTNEYYKRCPAMTCTGSGSFPELAHALRDILCSPADTAFVAKYAPDLKSDTVKRVYDELGWSERDGLLTGASCSPLKPITRCQSDKQFLCRHRDAAFYQDHFGELERNLLQLIIRRLKLHTEEDARCQDPLYQMITCRRAGGKHQYYEMWRVSAV